MSGGGASADDPAAGQGTIRAYEAGAAAWEAARAPSSLRQSEALAQRYRRASSSGNDRRPVADLGCGPGWHLPALPRPAVAMDAARAMLDLVPSHASGAARVQADLRDLPFTTGALGAALASKAYVHLDGRSVPRALADLHRALAPDGPFALSFFGSGASAEGASQAATTFEDDAFPGRSFSLWNRGMLADVLEGAGLAVGELTVETAGDGVPQLWAIGRRRRTLPDTVGPGMRLLICGLNPSLNAADSGIGFVTPGNRFWPAALEVGLVTRDREPRHALDHHAIGMTDLAKRATRRADELGADEYREGLQRVERLVNWLRPGAVCFVGLAGYRTAVDRKAVAGAQDRELGGRPVYVMPSTSGLNAHSQLPDLADHLHQAMELAGAGRDT